MVVALSAAGGTISLLVGAVLMRLTVTGTYRRYVRVEMRPWLLIAALAVILLGAITLVRALRHARFVDAHGHHRDGADRVGWLLLAPIAALLLVAPPTLGSYGVDRGAVVDVRAGAPVFDPLPAGAPVPMTLLEFGQRAFDHAGASFGDALVRLTGFVAGAEDDGFRLARYQIACCAADATPVVIRVVGIHGVPLSRDRWVSVVGSFDPGGGDVPRLAATSVVQIPTPDEPYE